MTTKELAIKTIEQLPEDATWQDIQDRVDFVADVFQAVVTSLPISASDRGMDSPGFARFLLLRLWAT
jgi:hypothetical protein